MKNTIVPQPPASQIYSVLEAVRRYATGQRCRTCGVCSKKWMVCELSCCPQDWDPVVLKEIAEFLAHGDQTDLFNSKGGKS